MRQEVHFGFGRGDSTFPAMRYAILADIHANLPALEAVIADSRNEGCARFAMLGDYVNYGRDPRACLELIRKLPAVCVLGNHDQACSHDPADARYQPSAERMFRSTARRLLAEQRVWLQGLPLTRELDGCTLVHASLVDPAAWPYIFAPADAAASIALQETPVCFFGHTHLPQIFTGQHGLSRPAEGRIGLVEGQKYLINPGSVGLSRDPDPRAAYCVYDTDAGLVEFRRVRFEPTSLGRAEVSSLAECTA